ncbi:MAG: hypothetical protein Cons2KO_07550 [Congregibacter sp.]
MKSFPCLFPGRICLSLVAVTLWSTGLASAASLFDLGERYFEAFDDQQGLTADIVMDIQQDATGFIWLGTQSGLVRYDGYEFTSFNYAEDDPRSISGNYVRTLAVVGGKLWAGTNADGISIYDPMSGEFTRIQNDPQDKQSLADNDVWSLTSDDESVVAATRTGITVFNREDGNTRRVEEIQGCEFLFNEGRLSSLFLDSERLFIGSFFGLCRVDLRLQPLFSSSWKGEEVSGLSGQRVFSVDRLRENELWVTTRNNGIAVIDLQSDGVRWIPVDAENPAALNNAWVDEVALVDGAVWAATAGGGIAIIDPNSLSVKEHIIHQPASVTGLALNDVSAVFKDDTGIVWLGTWGEGLNRFNPANSAFKILRQNPYNKNSLGDSHIQSVKELQNGDVWLGTALSGVQVVRPGVGVVKSYTAVPGEEGALQNSFIHSIEQLPNGEVWVGTNQTGAYRYNPATDDFTQFTTEQGLTDDLVRTLFADDEGTLWMGTDAGLTRADPRTETFEAVKIAGSGEVLDKLVGTIAQYQGDLWVGTGDGLYLIPRGMNTALALKVDPQWPLADNYISDLMLDSRGWLWVSTSQGVNVLQGWDGEAAQFRSVNEALGLPAGSLGGAMEEDGLVRIWLQSLLIDPRDWSSKRINRSDGWDVGNTWNGSNEKLSDGTLLFGGTRGLMMVRPEAFRQTSDPARVVITHAELDSNPLSLDQMAPMVLPAGIKSFSVEFAALNYAHSKQMQYRYKLEGYDDEWVTTSAKNRRATYSRLAPDDYTLRLGSAVTGDTEFMEISIPITQLPRWYETAVFRITSAMFAMVLMYLLYRQRVQTLYRQKQALDLLVERRTQNIRQLAQAGQDITASLNIDQVVHAIKDHVSSLMAVDVFAIGLLDAQSDCLDVKFHYEEGQRIEGLHRDLSDKTSAAVWCVRHRKVLAISSEDELREVSPTLRLTERPRRMHSLIFHPLIVDDKAIGFLSLQSHEVNAYGDNEQQMLKTLAAYAAGAIDNAESLRKLNEAKAEIERVSLTDQLTGLSNRRFLEKFIPGEINRLQRLIAGGSEERLGLIMVDADHFKQVNDTHGHDAGDRVLVQLAEILKSACREMDWAIRLGGEEFLVVTRVNNRDQLLGLAERFRRNVESHSFDIGAPDSLRKTCSIGVCSYPFVIDEASSLSWERTMGLADEALYMAKHEGRNRWVALFERELLDAKSIVDASSEDLQGLINTNQIVAVRSEGVVEKLVHQ